MFKELSYVIAIAEYGNVSKAAEKLFISQPSLSRYIRDLENRLGIQLFFRKNNRFFLTQAGEKYVETAKKIIELYEGLEAELSNINIELRGTLRVGCAILRMAYNMPEIFKAFMNKYPNVDLQLYEDYTTKGIEDMLLRGDIDLAIINQRKLSKIKYIPILEEELLIVTSATSNLGQESKNKPEFKYPWIDVSILNERPYIALNNEQSISIKMREIFQEKNVKPEVVMRVKSVESAFKMAEIGIGFTVVPETIANSLNYSTDSGVNLFSFGDVVTKWNLAVAYNKDSILSKTAREFVKQVRSMF